MNLIRPLCFLLALTILGSRLALADSATWNLNPTNGDWNTADNWTPATVPFFIDDIATFDVSNVTSVSMSAEGEIGEIVFNPGASTFTLDLRVGFVSNTLPMRGVTNNSGVTQFITASTPGMFTPAITFAEGAHAGKNVTYTVTDEIEFFNHSTADGSAIVVENGGDVLFRNKSTAGESTVTVYEGGLVNFIDESTADDSTLIVEGGITFEDNANGGTARVELKHFGTVIVKDTNLHAPLTIGSIEGHGSVILARPLRVGSNDLDTVFTGYISSAAEDFLTKIGRGTLTLTGNNPHLTSAVQIKAGALRVGGNTSGSGTGTGTVTVFGGSLGGRGAIDGLVTIGTENGGQASLAPSVGSSQPNTLTIRNLLTIKADGRYVCKLSTDTATADQVTANGVTIEDGAQFLIVSQGTAALASGTVLTVVSNTSTNPINGTFTNLPDGSTITIDNNTFQANYEGGDGNDLTLTVVP